MSYVSDTAGLQRQADLLRLVNEACLRKGPHLTVLLREGHQVSGLYYGARITVSSEGRLSCSVELGDETSDYCGVFDVLDIQTIA
jgi:hypothetical protein